MLDVLNAIYLGAILIANITLYPTGETPVPTEIDTFVETKYHREYWRDDGNGKCSYDGVLVPYVRTWPLEVQRGDMVDILPPEPNKIAGYVAVVTTMTCKGKEPVAIFRAGIPSTRKPFFGSRQIDKHTFFQSGDMLKTPADKIPQWLPQVIERMAMLAKTDKKAEAFMTTSASVLSQALPGLPALAGVAQKPVLDGKTTPAPDDAPVPVSAVSDVAQATAVQAPSSPEDSK